MRVLISIVVFVAATAVAVPVSAQGTGSSSSTQKPSSKPAKPKKPREPLGFRAFFTLDTAMMSASKSFTAVTGSPTMFGYGAGAELQNIWKKIFVRFAFASASKGGERVLVDGQNIIPSGFPIDTGIRSVELGGGWRMALKKRPKLALYAGAGLLFTKYTETSPFAAADENVAVSFRGYSVQGGLEMKLSKWFTASGEAQYRLVPDALGTTGVSKVYGEDNLNSLVIRAMVGVRFGK